jgi:hypothetical protein
MVYINVDWIKLTHDSLYSVSCRDRDETLIYNMKKLLGELVLLIVHKEAADIKSCTTMNKLASGCRSLNYQ